MGFKLVYVLTTALALHIIGAAQLTCPSYPNCVCGGTFAVELNCNIDGRIVKINLLPNTYINIKCENSTSLDYSKLPKCANQMNTFKSVSFKDCPLPSTSFKDVLAQLGVSKTMSLIFQNAKNLSGYFDRKHFTGLQDLTKLLLSVNGVTHLPDNLFTDINNVTWLNIRCNSINLSEELFKPLERLETLEISHNHLTNMSSNLFAHLSFLRKLSLWQSNVTWFSKDFFTGIDVLEELDLSSNGLNELPPLIFKPLRKLKKLTLFANKFSSLPHNLFTENINLETVIILNNDVKIKQLPKYLFGNLPNLKQIYIQRCGLQDVPYDIFGNSSGITNISLAYNDINKLQESTFNDQINLLELDLSHNNLKSLEPKLFSSLVRLENLNLCHNSIEEISGSTFSSLLSLIYLNMENNNLKIISSSLFCNNKQRMSISFAYNKLDFEYKELENKPWKVKTISPFEATYNLRLLNLSHNQFKKAAIDLWTNGYDSLDISFNSIEYLWELNGLDNSLKQLLLLSRQQQYQVFLRNPIKKIWFSNNALKCHCINFDFIEYLQTHFKTKIMDDGFTHCSIWLRNLCSIPKYAVGINLAFFALVSVLLATVMIMLKIIKPIDLTTKISSQNIVVKYSEKDEEFVLKEMLPGLRINKNLVIYTKPINKPAKKNFIQKITNKIPESDTTIVIFSPNYLTSAYSHVNIKKIRGEMLKAKNTVYVFTDIGPENSIYAFLKDQRDHNSTILWTVPNFWNTLMLKLVSTKYGITKPGTKPLNGSKGKFSPSAASFTQPSDWAQIYALDTVPHSQV